MEDARLMALYQEYVSSNPYVGSTTFEQFKEEMYGIVTAPATAVAVVSPLVIMTDTESRTSGSPVQGVYKQNPGMPPASTGIPTSSKAMAATKCPYCHKHDGEDMGELDTKDVFGKLKAVVGGNGKRLAVQLEDMVRSLAAFKGQPNKLSEDRASYFSEVKRALETEIMRKKAVSQDQAQEIIGRWAERWNRLWTEFVVPSRQAYAHVHVSAGKGKKQFSSSEIASASYALIEANLKDAAPNELELAKEMLSAMSEILRLAGEDAVDMLTGLFGGGGGSTPAPQTDFEQTMGKMFGTAMRAHLGGEKARMAAAAFKKGAERAMMAAAADGLDEGDLSSADYEPSSKNSRLAEFIDLRSSALKLAPEESYFMLLPDESVAPDLLDKLESMSPDDASNFVRAHAVPMGSYTQESDGVTRFVSMSGKTYAVVQMGEEVPVLYEVDASGKRLEESASVQVGGPIHRSGGRILFLFFRRQFMKPEDAGRVMIVAAAKKGGGGGGGTTASPVHSAAHNELASHPHLSAFAKMAHDSKVDHTLSQHTVFAPKNSALTKPVPADRQRRLVESHIVKGRLERASELNGRKQTLAGTEITVDGSRGTVNGIKYRLAKAHPHLVIYELDSPLVK